VYAALCDDSGDDRRGGHARTISSKSREWSTCGAKATTPSKAIPCATECARRSADADMVIGIPLSVTGKNPLFDAMETGMYQQAAM
jgi:hypothetical protein